MLEKLRSVRDRHEELTKLLSDPKVLSDHNLMKKYSKERAGLDEVARAAEEYEKVLSDIRDARELLESSDDKEAREFAREELESLE